MRVVRTLAGMTSPAAPMPEPFGSATALFTQPRFEEPVPVVVDPLGEALHYLRMDGAFYCRSELTAPFGAEMPPLPQYLWFHVVTTGEVWVATRDGQDQVLRAGDIALVTSGAGHDLLSAPGEPTVNLGDIEHQMVSERYEVLHLGGGGARSQLICAAVRFGHPAARNLVAALPELILLRTGQSPEHERIRRTLELMAVEAGSPSPGGEAVITRLADILVIQAIRAWIEHDPGARSGWVGALRDPQVGEAITLIHREPARDWTVASLADATAMSRSAFSARFTGLVGEPVMAYVTRWRMHLALDALQTERTTIAEQAARLGYRSEAAFARAFKRVIGVPPGAVRHSSPEDDLAVFGDVAAPSPTALTAGAPA